MVVTSHLEKSLVSKLFYLESFMSGDDFPPETTKI